MRRGDEKTNDRIDMRRRRMEMRNEEEKDRGDISRGCSKEEVMTDIRNKGTERPKTINIRSEDEDGDDR